MSTQNVADLSLQLNLEEVWNFKLHFLDFKATDLTYRGKDAKIRDAKLVPVLKISLESNSILTKNESVESGKANPSMPFWGKVGKDGITFKGTTIQLQS